MRRWIRKRLETIEKALIEGKISEEEYERLKEKYEKELSMLSREVERPMEPMAPEPTGVERLGGAAKPRARLPSAPRARARPPLRVAMAVVLASMLVTIVGLFYWGWIQLPTASQTAEEAVEKHPEAAFARVFQLSKFRNCTYKLILRSGGGSVEATMTIDASKSKLDGRDCILLKITSEVRGRRLTYEVWLDEEDKSCVRAVVEVGGERRELSCQQLSSNSPEIVLSTGELREAGSERIKVPAGVFQCRILEVRGEGAVVKYWVSGDAPVPVKATVEVGGSIVRELQLISYSS